LGQNLEEPQPKTGRVAPDLDSAFGGIKATEQQFDSVRMIISSKRITITLII